MMFFKYGSLFSELSPRVGELCVDKIIKLSLFSFRARARPFSYLSLFLFLFSRKQQQQTKHAEARTL